MLGWCTDLFRLFFGLIYWNARKGWFQARRGRTPCPCQSPSDSGRAMETQCEASLSWHRPARFRRVCPLLVDTPAGLRCSVDTPAVRPFWMRAFGVYGGIFVALYFTVVLGIFVFLRTVGYPVSVVHVALPPLWHRVGQARGWYYFDRSQHAFAAGNVREGLLALENAYQFDPTSYAAGIALAKNLQAGRPTRSDEVYQQLLREHPAQRHATAQDWFKALLARGSFARIGGLARDELLQDPIHAPVWVRALIFATRQTGDARVLSDLIRNPQPAAQLWRPLFEVELLRREGRTAEAAAQVERPWPATAPPFALFFRVNTLIELRNAYAALDLLEKHASLIDEEARRTLRLDALAVAGARKPRAQEIDELLSQRLTAQNLSIIKIVCAHLIRFPDAALYDRLWKKMERETIPLNTDSAGIWFSLLCTAGAVGDLPRLHELTARLKQASKTPFMALGVVEAFFRREISERRVTAILPILPLPLEVTYALIERYPAPGPAAR